MWPRTRLTQDVCDGDVGCDVVELLYEREGGGRVREGERGRE